MINTNEALATEKIREYNRLEGDRASLAIEWQNIAEYCAPHKANITRKTTKPSEYESRLFDTTAIDSLLVAAAGFMSYTTPKNQTWFAYKPTRGLEKNTRVRKWLGECSQLTYEYLANSNFYTERHESIIDKLAFGTSALYSALDDKDRLYFENVEVGSYVIKENVFGYIDTFIRKIKWTVSKSVNMFGFENLSKEMQDLYTNGQGDKEYEFLHVVEPRDDRLISANLIKSAKEKPFASYYVCMTSKKILKESGFDSFPFHVGRWLRWGGQYKYWGYGPGFSVLPEARQLNYYQKMMDIYAGKIVFPPLLVPNTFEGSLDTSMKAVNYYGAEMGPDSIRPLPIQGDLSAGLNRIEFRKKAIESKFFTDLWQMLSSRDRQKTATEVIELVNEKLDAISPAFDRDSTEVIEPMLQRLFTVLGTAGMLPSPPEEAISSIEGNMAEVPNPAVSFSGKLALAYNQLKNTQADKQLQRLAAIAQLNPSVMDVWNFDAWAKDTSLNANVSPEYIRDDEEVQMMREQRAQQQQMAQQAQMMSEAAKAVGPEATKEFVEGMM